MVRVVVDNMVVTTIVPDKSGSCTGSPARRSEKRMQELDRMDDQPRVTEVADGIFAIDTLFQGQPGSVAAYLVVGPDGLGLVETGPSTVSTALAAGVTAAGYAIDDITDIVVTHIHLDHAGALGGLMQQLEHVQAWVHPVGLPHMVNPEKLVNSASRIYGERMEQLWGEIIPAPEDRLHATEHRVPITVGGRMLVPFDTPGHASHHIALLDEQTGSLFTGDVAGVRVQGTSLAIPPMPPPDIDVDAWNRSIDLMLEIAPQRIMLTHFGSFTDVETHLAMVRDGIEAQMSIGREVLVPGGTDAEMTERLEAWVRQRLGNDAEAAWGALDAANPLFMGALGIRRVLRKAGELEA